jgi:hypothetical protein
MLTVKGIYKNGEIKLLNNVIFDTQMDVLITFLDDNEINNEKKSEKFTKTKFSFKKSRELLSNYKGSLSEAIIEERRSQL